jgi:hypothetical protein
VWRLELQFRVEQRNELGHVAAFVVELDPSPYDRGLLRHRRRSISYRTKVCSRVCAAWHPQNRDNASAGRQVRVSRSDCYWSPDRTSSLLIRVGEGEGVKGGDSFPWDDRHLKQG